MKNNPLILTLDFGTQSLRVSLVDNKGTFVVSEKIAYAPTYISTQKGYAENDADFYFNCCIEALKKICENNKETLADIIGATVTTFRDTAVLLDKNYKPLRKCILWLDQRSAEAKERLPFLHNFLYALVGMTDTVVFNRKRTAAHWVKENEPAIWSKTKKYVNISTYINYKLTGVLADSPSGMTGHYPLNYKKKVWYKDGALKNVFGVPNFMLPELKEPGEVIGVIKDELADLVGLPHGIKLYVTGSDKGCETVGLGALSRDIAAVSYGTACSIEVSNQKYYEAERFLPSYAAAVPGWYNMDVQIYRGYWMLGWFTKEFAKSELNDAALQNMAVEEIFDANLSNIPAGSDGLVLQPYWGPGLSRPLAKGAIIGFSDIHTREHIYRAIIEGIAYALREGLEGIEKAQRHKVREIMISGGGSKSDAICQITADIFGLKVSRVQTNETTSLGAALSAFIGAGVFTSVEEATREMVHVSDTFVPNKLTAQKYQILYKKVYLKMYPSLRHSYKELTKFYKKY